MLKALLHRYLLKISFALALLVGLQLPNFLSLYETRLDAHYLESKLQLKQYQMLADLLFSGNLNKLVEKHKESDIPLFRAETVIIEKLITRANFLQSQKESLQGTVIQRYVFLLRQVNQPLFIETDKNYQANIVLSQEAIIIGLIVATMMTLLLEVLLSILGALLEKVTRGLGKKSIN